jgi:hypothetical protein
VLQPADQSETDVEQGKAVHSDGSQKDAAVLWYFSGEFESYIFLNLPSPGYCRRPTCKKTFFHSYEEEEVTVDGKNIILRKFYTVAEAFSYSRFSAFSKELLEEVTNTVVLEHSQFVNIVKTYNRMDRSRGQGDCHKALPQLRFENVIHVSV